MIPLTEEPLLSLTEAARTIPPIDGRTPHPSTVFRWMTDGVRGGVKLEHVRVGRRICTTEKAIERFINRLAETPAPAVQPQAQTPKGRSESQRRHDIEAARKRLQAAGIVR